jgi:hypothetical protein
LGVANTLAWLCIAAMLAVPFLFPRPPGLASPDRRFSQVLYRTDSGTGYPTAGVTGTGLPRLRFDWAGDFSDGLAPVKADGRFGFIDTAGRYRIMPGLEYAGGFSCGRAPALIGGRWGYLDVTGAIAIPAAYDWAGAFREGLAPVAADSTYGFIDTTGAYAGPLRFSDARPYSGGYAAVRFGEDGAWGFVDRQGSLAIPPLFNDVPGGFSEGLALVRMENERPFRSGFIDTSGGFAIDTLYDAAGDFHQGRAPVGRGEWHGNRFEGAWGYVDTTGRLVTGLTYLEAGPFQDGIALVRLLKGGGNALIGRDGRIITAFRDDAEVETGPESGMVTYKLHNLRGLLNPATGAAIPAAFAEAGALRQGWARVRIAGLDRRAWAYIDGNGRFLGGVADAATR